MNLKNKIKKLPKELVRTINLIGKMADKDEVNAYLVGGVVRDLLLGKKTFDLDFALEADAVRFAGSVNKKMRGALVSYKKFGTASIIKSCVKNICPSGYMKIDFATARKEKYKKPAALPEVKFSTLEKDLFRRDFTVNAMAIRINKNEFGELIDPFSGLEDLKDGIIRVLHEKSLIDDPTRIFRAFRFEQRFNFKIDKGTEAFIRSAVKKDMFARTGRERIRNELILIFKEQCPEKVLKRMRDFHELRFIHKNIKIGPGINKIYQNIRKYVAWYTNAGFSEKKFEMWILNFMPVLTGVTIQDIKAFSDEFRFTRKEKSILCDFKNNHEKIIKTLASSKTVTPVKIFYLLENRSLETIIFCMSSTSSGKVTARIKKFLLNYSKMTIKITGDDLKKLGISPGPRHKLILREILHAKLEKQVLTKKDEIKYLKKILAEYKHPELKVSHGKRHPERLEEFHK